MAPQDDNSLNQSDEIIERLKASLAALDSSLDAPDPPLDVVYGYYESINGAFKLHLQDLSCYMQHSKKRILSKSPVSNGGTQLVLDASEGYLAKLERRCRDGGEPVASAANSVPQTTPWHDWK